MSATEYWKQAQKEMYELYKKETAHSRQMFDEAIKLHTRCAVYAYTGFLSSIVAFGAGCLIGGLK